MGSMPHWFAKTKEMAAFDRYFSTFDTDEKGLLDRYLRALVRLDDRGAFYEQLRRARPPSGRRWPTPD